MFLVDYNPSLLREMDREDGYEDGFADGKTAGFSEGESAGFTRGESVGFTRGESAGFTRGEMESKKQIVRNMLAHGMADDEIMTLTDCPQDLIEDLRPHKEKGHEEKDHEEKGHKEKVMKKR